MKTPGLKTIEGQPWFIRAVLGSCVAATAVALTYEVEPLRATPLLLAFPTVVLSSWFLGMWGGIACALTDAILVDEFLTITQLRFSTGSTRGQIRLALFMLLSTLLSWAMRRLAHQRSELGHRELQQRLALADSERQLAEEKARASDTLRERDEALQIALRANGMGLWIWDLQHETVQWSEQIYRIIGIPVDSIEPSKAAWLGCIHPEDVAAVKEATYQARANGTDYHRQYRVIWPDSSTHWVDSIGHCQRDDAGRATRMMGVLSDITHRKRSEEAMLRAEKLAVAGRLAASVAHEINNPLEAVTNLLYLITLTDTMEGAKRHAEQALDELLRVSLITQSTLKFHRQPGVPKPTLLSEVLESVLALFRGRMLTSEISAEVQKQAEVPVACMPTEMQQIFANLVANAVEAMPRGGRLIVRLRLSVDWRDRQTPGMRVTFCDSGMGMDRSTIRRIFEPFFTTKVETGTGLGMWVVAQLVERHHGHISLWSRQSLETSGTVFSVFLPIGKTSVRGAAMGSPSIEALSDEIIDSIQR